MDKAIRFLPKQFNFKVLPQILEIVSALDEGEHEITIKKVRNKRSLTQNGYYWALLEDIAKALQTSKDEVHETMLQRYGTFFYENDEPVTISSKVEIDPLKSEVHCRYRGSSELNGSTFYHYYLIKGSRCYNSKEMSDLINGAVSEAKEMGIEVLSDSEIALLRGAD